MAKLWDKGYRLDEVVERFTVGRDYLLDRQLVVADAAASVAHARMLGKTGLIGGAEAEAISRELERIGREGLAGKVAISRSDEDCHTVIEGLLIAALGETGKKVHTGRSRNDQVAAATRLYTREVLLDVTEGALDLVDLLVGRAEEEKGTVMPGRTHLQIAMLSTFGLWLASWAEQLLDDLSLLRATAELNNRSPLGSAAGYGTPLPLDREYVSEALGFKTIQNNVLAVQHTRGTLDGRIAESLAGMAATFGRIAADLMIFSLPEVGYFTLPDELCSGSSIMPQKKNPDVLELLRARAAVVDGYATQCRGVVRSLPSGYNRDLQDTKEPLLRALSTLEEEIAVMIVLVERLKPQRARMAEGLNAEVFATDYAYALVEEGVPFRDAYRKAAAEYRSQSLPDPAAALEKRRSTGTPGNLNLDEPAGRAADLRAYAAWERQRHVSALQRIFPSGEITSVRPISPDGAA